jgi:hypothetical protein
MAGKLGGTKSLRHKNDRMPFATTASGGIRRRKKTQSP